MPENTEQDFESLLDRVTAERREERAEDVARENAIDRLITAALQNRAGNPT